MGRRAAKVNKERGYWQSDNPPHLTATEIQKYLVDFCKDNDIKSIIDFGCGDASYIREIKNNINNLDRIEAFDGNPNTEYLTDGLGKCKDLTIPFNLNYKFDLSISFEVAEHIPKKYESIYIDNILNHTKKHLIISWAVEGQGGSGHFNEQNNEYVIKLFNNFGLEYQEKESLNFRKGTYKKCRHFKRTIMYFKRSQL
tara:strand:- start:212 stop:805 length:594 start_codon:yes stop_codon:yes gene_type:complete